MLFIKITSSLFVGKPSFSIESSFSIYVVSFCFIFEVNFQKKKKKKQI